MMNILRNQEKESVSIWKHQSSEEGRNDRRSANSINFLELCGTISFFAFLLQDSNAKV